MTIYSNLGNRYYDMQQYTEAKRFLQNAYDIYREALGNDHPKTKIVQSDLELVQKILGELIRNAGKVLFSCPASYKFNAQPDHAPIYLLPLRCTGLFS